MSPVLDLYPLTERWMMRLQLSRVNSLINWLLVAMKLSFQDTHVRKSTKKCGLRIYLPLTCQLYSGSQTLKTALDLIFTSLSCEKVTVVPDTNHIASAIRKFMMDM